MHCLIWLISDMSCIPICTKSRGTPCTSVASESDGDDFLSLRIRAVAFSCNICIGFIGFGTGCSVVYRESKSHG